MWLPAALRVLAVLVLMSPPAATAAASLVDLLADVPHREAESVDSAAPAAAEDARFDAALTVLLDGGAIAPAGFRIEAVAEDGRAFRVLLPTMPGFAPVVAIAATPRRDAMLEAPHPIFDRETGKQAMLFLHRLGARAAIVSTHHRCAAGAETPCSGRTAACGGGSRRYRDSDPAHNDALLFHRAHVRLAALWPSSVIVQLHGFDGRGYDSLFVMSDGSGEARSGDTRLVGRVRTGVRAALGDEAAAIDCQDPDDKRFRYPALCARTNVQGRELNGSPDSCRRNAPSSSGRFLHIEQSWDVRQPVRHGWRRALEDRRLRALFDALAAGLPCLAAGGCRN